MSQVLEILKPLSCTIEGGTKRTVFNTEELRRFVQNTDETVFIVENDEGNQSAILVQPILEFLSGKPSR